MKTLRLSACSLLVIVSLFILSACNYTVTNSADELKLNKWSAELNNGSVVSLSFSDDCATLKITNSELEDSTISGLCEVSSTAFVIHDESTKIPFAFSYIVHFDSVEIVCEGNTVSLYKS